jgi:hypothetical protein
MKPAKMLGLAMLAALMAMALAGPSSAMGESTSFCNVDPGEGPEEVCPAGHLITHLHAATAAELPAAVLTSFITVACSVLYLADTTATLANPLVLEGTFTYTNCSNGCSITEENGPSQIKVLKLGHEKADANLEFLIHVKCAASIDCSFIGAGMKGLFKGALLPFAEGEDEFGEAKLTKEAGGFLCPKTAPLLDLLVFSLSTFYITN